MNYMIPGFSGLNPRKMQGLMKQMGLSQEEIDALRVIIEKEDNSRIIIENPSVSKIKIQGQEIIQVAGGEIKEENTSLEISEQDIKTIIEKTGVSEEKAREVLEETGDLAEAILKLSE